MEEKVQESDSISNILKGEQTCICRRLAHGAHTISQLGPLEAGWLEVIFGLALQVAHRRGWDIAFICSYKIVYRLHKSQH